jgi:hypothetical protein
MTYFLQARPMERELETNWHPWIVCYDMIRDEEWFPPRQILWRHFNYIDLSSTEQEDNGDSDESALL